MLSVLVTVKVIVPAASLTVTSLIGQLGSGGSLSVMVPTPCASAIVALLAALRLTLKVSVASAAVSLRWRPRTSASWCRAQSSA